MNTFPGITVIIPTYNSEKFLKKAIDSVLTQRYGGEIEVIISDDGSRDNTIAVASAFGEKVKILPKPQNCYSQGAAGARNRGIGAAKQPFISFLDSDDFYLKDHFFKCLKIFDSNPDIGFVFSRVLECKEINGKTVFREWTHPKVNRQDIKNPVVSRSHIVHTNSFIFKKEVFGKAGLFNENYSNGEDGDMWMRISEIYKGDFAGHYGAAYRSDHSEGQLTKNQEEKVAHNSLAIFSNARNRYRQLKLKDSFRIFKIEYNILYTKYGNYKPTYHLKYVELILKYPASILYILRDYFYNHQKNRNLNFKDISFFIK